MLKSAVSWQKRMFFAPTAAAKSGLAPILCCKTQELALPVGLPIVLTSLLPRHCRQHRQHRIGVIIPPEYWQDSTK